MVTMQIQGASLAFAEREILKDVSFTMDSNTRAALAGANGCGKSTLLKVVSGLMEADSLSVSKTKGILVSYLPQADIVLPDVSVYAAAEEGYDRFKTLLEEMENIGHELENISEGETYHHLVNRMDEIQEVLEDSGYYQRKTRIEQILSGLGFKEKDFQRHCHVFSGGWQMRIALSKILIENPDIMLLDEPTNYLDIEATLWLKNYLKAFHGGVMLVSHDQDFLDDTVNCVYELFRGKLTRYAGNYTQYLKTREMEIEQIEKAYQLQQQEIEKTEEFIERFRYKATKSKQVQSRIKALEKIDIIEIPEHLRKLHFSFPPAPHSGNDVMVVENLYKAFKDNVIYNDFSFLVKKKERLAITGRNGAGKSTLLRILAGVDEDYKGLVRDGAGVKKGYFAQDNADSLNPSYTVLEELEAVADTKDLPKLRNLLGSFLFQDDDVFKQTSVLSGGEKSRLSLMKILLHPANLLLLDEPTNHLDINAKEMLLEAIKAYDGTVIFVSHDTHFIKNLATRILYLSDDGPEFFEGDYDYFSYKLEEKEAKLSIVKETKKEEKKSSEVLVKAADHKEQKAQRNLIQKKEKEARELLDKCEKLRNEIAKLDEEISRPEVYSDSIKVTKLLKEKEEKEAQADEMEESWLLLSEELEELKANIL
ncbi:MAG: ATP-binding cassette domain-containing protein [Sphaerochaetaceae bacterium]|nr:ATP-binding cassette domain-containing protein [Sphaerochaetaceae bacterium]